MEVTIPARFPQRLGGTSKGFHSWKHSSSCHQRCFNPRSRWFLGRQNIWPPVFRESEKLNQQTIQSTQLMGTTNVIKGPQGQGLTGSLWEIAAQAATAANHCKSIELNLNLYLSKGLYPPGNQHKYPIKNHLWTWCSFPKGGICCFPGGYSIRSAKPSPWFIPCLADTDALWLRARKNDSVSWYGFPSAKGGRREITKGFHGIISQSLT